MIALRSKRLSLPGSDRRDFLRSLAAVGVMPLLKAEKRSEPMYKILTPEYEIHLRVQYFARSSANSFHFRDQLTNRGFCLSAKGEKDQNCVEQFAGSMAIAHYDFHSRIHSQAPLALREHVVTIDHDNRMSPRPPFEKMLSAEKQVFSDIQAFGFKLDDPQPGATNAERHEVWCLLRQDLYLSDRSEAFLTVHWKHTIDFISLVDIIPGDGTELTGR
jgi:hypothetical protein